MRLIDADALYEKVQHDEELARNRVLDTESTLPYSNNLNPSYTRYVEQMYERTRLKFMIADAPIIEPEQRWILCSERLPEMYRTYYLVSLADKKEVDIAYFIEYGTWETFRNDEVIAWMPLPEPYREEGEE